MQRLETCVASYSFHGARAEGKCDVFRYLDLLRFRYGVRAADLWTGFLPTLDEDFLRKVRDALDRNGLFLANLCVDGPHVWMDDAEEREAHRRQMFAMLRAAKILGARTVRIDFGGTEGHTMPEEAFDYIVSAYRAYAAFCGDEGMKVGPENHWGWDRVPAYLMKVHEAVNDPAYGHLYHLRNFFDNAEEGEAFCIKNAMHTHIHANSVPYAIDVVRKLAAGNYTGTYGIEHHSGKLEPVRVEWQLASLREIIAEVQEENAGGEAAPEAFMNKIYK